MQPKALGKHLNIALLGARYWGAGCRCHDIAMTIGSGGKIGDAGDFQSPKKSA